MSKINWLLPVAVICFVSSAEVFAQEEWVQWGGADRDFQVKAELSTGEISVKEIWRRDLGPGYSAILVEDGKLYTMYRDADQEITVCLDQGSGETVWQQSYDAPLDEDADTSFGKGPNATPILHGDRLLTIGFNGDLVCRNKNTGEQQWRQNLIKDLEGTPVSFGYSPSPLVYDDKLVVPVGGAGKGIVALNLNDGGVAWSSQDFKNSYSTPVLAEVDGLNQLIFVMTDEVVAINPDDGQLYWSFPLKNQWSTHAFVPLWDDESNTLFVSSFRQSHALKLSRNGDSITFEKKWSNERSGVGFTNAVNLNGVIYGSTGGSRSPLVTAIELESGNVRFRERGFGVSNYLAVNNRLLLLDENGVLAIADPTEDKLNVTQQLEVLTSPKAWTVPTLVGNRLYVRDQKEIVAFELN